MVVHIIDGGGRAEPRVWLQRWAIAPLTLAATAPELLVEAHRELGPSRTSRTAGIPDSCHARDNPCLLEHCVGIQHCFRRAPARSGHADECSRC